MGLPYTFKSPETVQEWQAYFLLRWQILREPWQQPPGSERDELENTAYHVMAVDDTLSVVGTGRLHRLSKTTAQIRYMAVCPHHQGYGIGGRILMMLEDQATNYWTCQEILLNARTTCLGFYQHHDYGVLGEAPLLFDEIAHKRMYKRLD